MNRSVQDLVEAIAAIDPANSFALMLRDGITLCNEAARFICGVLKVPLIRAKANDQRDWLAASTEWKTVDRETARQRICSGFPVLVVYKNPNPMKHGHICVGAPAPLSDPAGFYVAGAGETNTNCAPLATQFGSLPVEYFTHD